MSKKPSQYPVVDVFAGPGGLGEGFASFLADENPRFHSVASIEREEFSHQTLLLRHFFRSFPNGEAPDEYYKYLSNEIRIEDLFNCYKNEFDEAKNSALRISLGPENHDQVKRIIGSRISGTNKWALVGGPPCQAYSLVGRSRMMGNPGFERDERHFLYREYLKIIVDHQPPVFVMENVKGLLSAKINGKPLINRIVSDLSQPKAALEKGSNGLGYRLFSLSEEETPEGDIDPRLFLVRAENYGVPQARHRMFIVGIRSDLDIKPRTLRSQRSPTVAQTIGNLPEIRSGISRGRDSAEKWKKEIAALSKLNLKKQLNGNPFSGEIISTINSLSNENSHPVERVSLRYPSRPRVRHESLNSTYDRRLTVLTGHEARAHMPSDLRRYMFASVYASTVGKSPKLADFPRSLLPAHKNVEQGRSGTMFSDRFRVQLPDQVSTTITSHISKDGHYFIHYDPSQCRSLTVREAARLQTFPDNYKFEGPRTSQYHQVGNAVPPYLARQIAEIIAEVLDSMKGNP